MGASKKGGSGGINPKGKECTDVKKNKVFNCQTEVLCGYRITLPGGITKHIWADVEMFNTTSVDVSIIVDITEHWTSPSAPLTGVSVEKKYQVMNLLESIDWW